MSLIFEQRNTKNSLSNAAFLDAVKKIVDGERRENERSVEQDAVENFDGQVHTDSSDNADILQDGQSENAVGRQDENAD